MHADCATARLTNNTSAILVGLARCSLGMTTAQLEVGEDS